MRFTRAAKVAAFPLLAMVLVVALIACQGPVGKAGDAGEKGDTGAGTPGADAQPAFQAMAVPVVIFNTQEGEDNADTDGEEKDPMDLNDFVANASGDVSFEIIDTSGWVAPANYDLDGSMLTLSVIDDFNPAVGTHAEDAVIRIEATDGGDSAVLHVRVRGNMPPARGSTQNITLVVGTQDAPAGDGDKPDYYDMAPNADDVTCAMLNACAIDLKGLFSDGNLRDDDSLTYKAYVADNDDISVETNDTGVMIMGLKGQATAIPVLVWAVDDGLLPMNRPDDASSAEDDETETEPYPPDASIITINVTVDRAPYMSDSAVGAVSLSVNDMAKVVGNVFDENLDGIDVTYTPAIGDQNDQGGIAEVTEGTADTAATPNRLPFSVNGINAGTVTLTVKAAEVDTDNNVPDQYAEHMITVTVSRNSP